MISVGSFLILHRMFSAEGSLKPALIPFQLQKIRYSLDSFRWGAHLELLHYVQLFRACPRRLVWRRFIHFFPGHSWSLTRVTCRDQELVVGVSSYHVWNPIPCKVSLTWMITAVRARKVGNFQSNFYVKAFLLWFVTWDPKT